jgi:hypothetical protein
VWPRVTGLLFGVAATAAAFAPAQAACEFSVVKQQIDMVLDRDPEKAATFRREVSTGSDSLEVIGSLVSPEMREKIDICRFEASEYLAKRGFAPGAH